MRTAVAVLAVFALLVSTPVIALSQSPTPPAQTPPASPAPSQTQSSATSVEGVVANVDVTCGGKVSADCQAIVEVTPAPASQGGTGSTSTSSTPTASMKIMIPKNLKITSEGTTASGTAPVKLAKGDKVKITYEKKENANVATSVTVTKPGS